MTWITEAFQWTQLLCCEFLWNVCRVDRVQLAHGYFTEHYIVAILNGTGQVIHLDWRQRTSFYPPIISKLRWKTKKKTVSLNISVRMLLFFVSFPFDHLIRNGKGYNWNIKNPFIVGCWFQLDSFYFRPNRLSSFICFLPNFSPHFDASFHHLCLTLSPGRSNESIIITANPLPSIWIVLFALAVC